MPSYSTQDRLQAEILKYPTLTDLRTQRPRLYLVALRHPQLTLPPDLASLTPKPKPPPRIKPRELHRALIREYLDTLPTSAFHEYCNRDVLDALIPRTQVTNTPLTLNLLNFELRYHPRVQGLIKRSLDPKAARQFFNVSHVTSLYFKIGPKPLHPQRQLPLQDPPATPPPPPPGFLEFLNSLTPAPKHHLLTVYRQYPIKVGPRIFARLIREHTPYRIIRLRMPDGRKAQFIDMTQPAKPKPRV